MTLNEEKQLKGYIKDILKEEFFNEFAIYEKDGKGKKSKKKNKKNNDKVFGKEKTGRMSDEAQQKIPGKRGHVISMLKNPGLDNAPYAYRLWPKKEKANARSQFYKCRDGKKNDNGDVYSFTDREIVRLYSMLTDTNILSIK